MSTTDAFAYLTRGAVDVVTADALKAKLALGRPSPSRWASTRPPPTSTSATPC